MNVVNVVKDAMSIILREPGIQTVHDRVVSEVAQRWAKAFQCRVTIKTSPDQKLWVDPRQLADIVGWYFSPRGNSMEWMAEVETEDTLSDPATLVRWQGSAVPGIPMYLLIPRGTVDIAKELAAAVGVRFTGIYQYSFFNGAVQLL
jgi:hypothetical protein